jgi:phage/plasmid primase-like uncharacterized protein
MTKHFPRGVSAPDFAHAEAIRQALRDRAEDLFRLAWGEPLKTGGKDWRASSSSARSMVMQGPKRGQWFDHAAGTGGDLLELVAIELCGLSSAQTDFRRVLQEAARFCGMAQGESPDLSALVAKRAAQEAEGKQQAAAEAQRKAKLVKALQARALPLSGSPAASYLASRGIDALPEGWCYLPPVPGVGVLHPERPALVAWAIDAAGQVTGGQRVLILEDGSRAPEDPRKPAFGSIGGSPARIPAKVAGGPLCIAEGPETAAAIAQATGFETWAVFGASGFASAPAPLDRQVILCPDCDAPGSPAAEAFTRACEDLAQRGVDLWIAPAPEAEGSKRDLADTLQERGPDAVAKAVKGATRFTTPRDGKGRFTGAGVLAAEPLPMPDFLTPEEARERIREAVGGYLAKVAKWYKARAAWAAYCEDETREAPPADVAKIAQQPAPVLAIAASPGAGKSRIAREVLAEFDLAAFGGGDVVFTAPTLQLAEEAAEHTQKLRAGGHMTRGRPAINPATGQPMCARSELADAVAKAGLSVKPTLCERRQKDGPPVLCPHFYTCSYLRQWQDLEEAPALRFEASAYLAFPGDGSGRATGLRVIDESIWQLFTRKADLPLDRWLRPRHVSPQGGKDGPAEADKAAAAAMAESMTKAAQDVLSALQDGKSPLALPYTAEQFRAFAQAERGPDVLSIWPSRDDAEIAKALAEFEAAGDPDAGKRAAVWRILADCAERGLPDTERLQLVRDAPINGTKEKRDVLRATWFAEPPRDVPALLLDADATPEIVDRMFPGADLVRVDLRPNAEVLQVTDKTFSKASLQRKTVRAQLVSLVRAEVFAAQCAREREGGNSAKQGGVLVIASKAVVRQFFEDAGHNFDNMSGKEISDFMRATPLHGARWLWFGPAALGLNDWQHFDTAVVIGREELPLQALQDDARAMFGDTGEPLDLISETKGSNIPEAVLPYLMADGSGAAVKARAHPDKRVRALQAQRRELATRQGFERLRLATAERRKRVVLVCKVPVPGLPVDRLVTMQELAPDRLEAAIAEAAQRGGVLRLSAAGLAEDAPETFSTAKAAERWLESPEGKAAFNPPEPVIIYTISGQGGLNPVRVRLKVQGQRGPRPTPALVILPGNPRDIAEAKLGPLAMFELEKDPGGSLKAVKAPEVSLRAGTEAPDTDLSAVTTQEDLKPLVPEVVTIPESRKAKDDGAAQRIGITRLRRLVILPPEEQRQSPLLARYILDRRSIRLGQRIRETIAGATSQRLQRPPGAAWV